MSAGAPCSICLIERVAGRVGNHRLLSGLALPLRGGLVERVLQARGREHQNVTALGAGGCACRTPGHERGEKQGQPRTSCDHHCRTPGALCFSEYIGASIVISRFISITVSRLLRLPASPAGLTRGSILFLRRWIAGSSPAMTADFASSWLARGYSAATPASPKNIVASPAMSAARLAVRSGW